MTSVTHYAFSYLVTSAAGASPQTAMATSLLSLLPDIDHPESLVGRIFPGISRRILKKYGHRTVTHSLIAILFVMVLSSPALFVSGSCYMAAVLAYSSHIFIDLFNRSGVKLMAPFSQKEYISFRTPELRIVVSSWKEYVLLFIIVFMAFTVTGRSFSIHTAVRSLSRVFYRNYDGAIRDFHDNSEYICNAKVIYFDNVSRNIKTETMQVLAMFPEKAYLLKDHERIILKKSEIDEIEILKTDRKISMKTLSGSDLNWLSDVPPGSFVSGSVTISGYTPDIKNSDFINIEKGVDKISLVLTCVTPRELQQIKNIESDRLEEIEKLKKSLCSYKIDQLTIEEGNLKAKISRLKSGGFYSNYSKIMKLNSELGKLQSRIDTLRMNQAAGADEETVRNIESLASRFKVSFYCNYWRAL